MPLQMGDITDIRVTQSSDSFGDVRLHATVLYSFKVRGQGPFEVQIKRVDFSAATALAVIQAFASEIIKTLEGV